MISSTVGHQHAHSGGWTPISLASEFRDAVVGQIALTSRQALPERVTCREITQDVPQAALCSDAKEHKIARGGSRRS